MNKRGFKYIALFAVFVSLLTLTAGCAEILFAGGLGTFGLGYLFGSATAPTVTNTQCFANGVEIDCANLP